MIKNFANRSLTKKNTHTRFQTSTRGDWEYLSGQYIIDCFTSTQLLDPSADGNYQFKVDRSHWAKSRASSTSRHVQRQRFVNALPEQHAEQQGILGRTALQRFRQQEKFSVQEKIKARQLQQLRDVSVTCIINVCMLGACLRDYMFKLIHV